MELNGSWLDCTVVWRDHGNKGGQAGRSRDNLFVHLRLIGVIDGCFLEGGVLSVLTISTIPALLTLLALLVSRSSFPLSTLSSWGMRGEIRLVITSIDHTNISTII